MVLELYCMTWKTSAEWNTNGALSITGGFALSKGLNKIRVSLNSPDDGNRSGVRKVVLPRNLEFRTMDKVHKPSDSERCSMLDKFT
jgi:hypothetical protein